MGSIINLSEELINKIAAGEVIERPASVVKELVENSLDAEADDITVEIDNDCLDITVRDNGNGMDKADALACVSRHGTSKIKTEDDLLLISTFGFRGEALSSIAAVSRFSLTTNNGNKAVKIVVEKGNPKISEVAAKKGTTVIVKDLFYNTPARKKHLSKKTTELAKIADVMTRIALVNPGIRISLASNSKKIISSKKNKDILSNISDLWGAIASYMVRVDVSNSINMTGAISKAGYQSANTNKQCLYVNKRPVRSKILRKSIYQAYHTKLNVGMHPAYVLDLTIDPETIDVNIHPRKETVKIQNEQTIADNLSEQLKEIIKTSEPDRTKKISVTDVDGRLSDYKFTTLEQKNFSAELPKHKFKILGQILKTYIVAQTDESMIIVDQHAAQERVLYERFMHQFKHESVTSQELVEPIIIEVTASEKIHINENIAFFKKSGYIVEQFGSNAFMIRSVPEIFKKLQGRDVFMTIVDELGHGKSGLLDKTKEERIIKKSCKTAIKAHEPLEYLEIVKVLDQLFDAKEPGSCPHGRPTMLKFTSADLEKMFKRRL